jgi:hypothetical protein
MSSRRIVAGTYFVVLCSLIQPSFGQQKFDQLLVYGDDFIFSVKEPADWKGDTTNANKFQSNVVLHETGQLPESFSGLIRIRVTDKADENTSADLAEDMRGYRAQYPNVQFKDLHVKHLRYQTVAKVFYVPDGFYEYVAYVNPGPGKPLLLSVSMSSQKSEASAKELEAYKSTVQSLRVLKP